MKRKLIAFTILVGALVLALAGCQAVAGIFSADVQDYFPFKEGVEWDYRVEMEFYGEASTEVFHVTLGVDGEDEINGTKVYILRLKDFTADNPDIDESEVNEMLESVQVYVAATEDGLEVFKIEVDQTETVDDFFRLMVNFTQGIAILPRYIFTGSESTFQIEQEDSYTGNDGLDYIDESTLDVNAEVIVVTDGDKRAFLDKDYRGAQVNAEIVVQNTDSRTYPTSPGDNYSSDGTVTVNGELFIARKLGFLFLGFEIAFSGDAGGEGAPHFITVELEDTALAD